VPASLAEHTTSLAVGNFCNSPLLQCRAAECKHCCISASLWNAQRQQPAANTATHQHQSGRLNSTAAAQQTIHIRRPQPSLQQHNCRFATPLPAQQLSLNNAQIGHLLKSTAAAAAEFSGMHTTTNKSPAVGQQHPGMHNHTSAPRHTQQRQLTAPVYSSTAAALWSTQQHPRKAPSNSLHLHSCPSLWNAQQQLSHGDGVELKLNLT
jgi:hypothetical protein